MLADANLSVQRRYCVKTNVNISSHYFDGLVGASFLFLRLTPLQDSKGNALSGSDKYMEGEKNLRFLTEIDVHLGNGTT